MSADEGLLNEEEFESGISKLAEFSGVLAKSLASL